MSFLTEDFRLTDIKKAKPVYKGLDASAHYWAGVYRRREVVRKELIESAQAIDSASGQWDGMSDELLKEKLDGFRTLIRRRGRGHEEALPLALGAIREAAWRRLKMRPYMVQIAGALALYGGNVAEMATGEGKTLVASLTAVLHGWSGFPCHIVTVNDYLAERDANWLRPLYEFCGVSSGFVIGSMEQEERRRGYRNDVTYTTSKEITADFLRDRLWLGGLQRYNRRQTANLLGNRAAITRGVVMRGIHTAIIDEADSVLIDEAVTPLIISRQAPNEVFVEACRTAHEIASELKKDVDYTVNYKHHEIDIGEPSKERISANANRLPEVFRGGERYLELVRQALIARELFHKGSQYEIKDGKVIIVDEFTGRLMHQRSWQAGLHQLIEAKENLDISVPTETLARLSFQRFFRLFRRLSGMTGTAREASSELWHIYELPVVPIPENKPCKRAELPQLVFSSQDEKWQAILDEVVGMHRLGRPVLIGTRSVESSEKFSNKLTEKGLPHRTLNAVRHSEEARIIAHAGERNAITVATNMAGRGTDILLGDGVAALGGLHVIASELHASRRIDRQLFGRSARQGDPGTCRSFVSFDDELMKRYLFEGLRVQVDRYKQDKKPHSEMIAQKTTRYAQYNAQKIAYKSRRSVLRTDTWLDDSLSFAAADVT